MNGFHAVTKNRIRIEVRDKVIGKTAYASDIKIKNLLYAKGVASKYASAKILNIDTSLALALSGVVCIVTANDIPGDKVIGEVVQDQYVFSCDRVMHKGDVVALVAAETYEIACEAAKLVKVEYEVLPAITDVHKAIDNPQVVNPNYPRNICAECHAGIGNVEKGFEEADAIVDEEYNTCYQEHAYLEPEVVLAIPGRRDREMIIKGCTQNLYMTRLSLKRCLNIPLAKATVIATPSGGSFGGKLESPEVMAVRAALVALKTGRPVKYILTREESITQSYKRHPFYFKFKAGATSDGKITALVADSLADGGAYVNMSDGVIFKAVSLGSGPYKIANTYCHSIAVMTNNIPTGSCRGFGNPQAIFARELGLTELAEKVGMSPYKFRQKNILKTGDISGTGQKMDFHKVSALEVLDKVASELDYEQKYWKYKKENEGKTIRRGVGLSLSHRGNSVGTGILDVGRVYIEVEQDASVLLSIGFTEIGQGLHTTMCQITAEALGTDFERVTINESDSSRSPLTGACIASRGTFIGGNAIIDAANKIKNIIAQSISETYNVDIKDIAFYGDEVTFKDKKLTFEKAVECCYNTGRTPASPGTYVVPDLKFDPETGEGDPFYEYTYSCIGTEVEIDTCTGESRVIKTVAAHDIGRAINPEMAKGQMYGGAVMSQGYGLLEDLGMSNGTVYHDNFDEYLLPTIMDVNDVKVIIVENPDNRGPFGARSLGEPSLDPGAAAFVNAVNNALGSLGKIRSLPANLEKILFAGND